MLAPYARILDGNLSSADQHARHIPDPVAIGAVGGSGTRLMARTLEAMGVAMATPVNSAGDALEWPPMRRLLSDSMLARFPREHILNNAFSGLEQLLALRRHNLGLSGRSGWKVPTTHLWLAELAQFFPGMQYIHLIRNGLDMAYSGNQRQAQHWASSQAVELTLDSDGRISLAQCWSIGSAPMKEPCRRAPVSGTAYAGDSLRRLVPESRARDS